MQSAVVSLVIVLQLVLATAVTPIAVQPPVVPQPAGVCQKFEHFYCNLFGYDDAFFPNAKRQDESDARTEFSHYEPLLYTRTSDGELCSEHLGTVLCFYYFPFCKEGSETTNVPSNRDNTNSDEWILPCKRTCLLAKEGCQEFMLNQQWPEHLDCSELPDTNCADGEQPPYPSRTGTRDPDFEEDNANGSASAEALCDPPSDPSNGIVLLEDTDTTVDSEAAYSCNEGYRLNGESVRTCQDDGQWSGSEPSCEPVDCGELSDPTNGDVAHDTTTVGSVARYSCSNHHILVGETARRCLASGTWSGREPVCECRRAHVCPRCTMRTRCTSNTFKRNGYTFAAWVTVLRNNSNTACNISYEVRVNEQYSTGAPTMPTGPGTQIQVDTTSGFGCAACPSGEHEVRVNADYLFAGYYEESPLRWYLDRTDSLVSQWTNKYERNMEEWVGKG